jgi:hypothetical protein
MTQTIKLVCLRDGCPHSEANTTCSVCGRRPTFDEDGHWSVRPPVQQLNGARPARERDRPFMPAPTPLGRVLDRLLCLQMDAVKTWNGLRDR